MELGNEQSKLAFSSLTLILFDSTAPCFKETYVYFIPYAGLQPRWTNLTVILQTLVWPQVLPA